MHTSVDSAIFILQKSFLPIFHSIFHQEFDGHINSLLDQEHKMLSGQCTVMFRAPVLDLVAIVITCQFLCSVLKSIHYDIALINVQVSPIHQNA